MADFDTAYEVTLGHEGGYANNPDDRGGETYRGISRRHHPGWPGWQRVEALKRSADFPASLDEDAALQKQVRSFYKEQFWDRFQGDKIPDQGVASEIFDTGVNMGLRQAVRFLQESINLLDRKPMSEGLTEDGWLGDGTLKALRRSLSQDKSNEFLMCLLNVLQGYRYVGIMRNQPSQKQFARGWLRRITL